jgi:hypothetical protein
MYPILSRRLLPEECQEYTLFLQPGLQPFLIAATSAWKEDEESEPNEKHSVIVIAFVAIFHGLSHLWSWLQRRLRRRRTIELPIHQVQR